MKKKKSDPGFDGVDGASECRAMDGHKDWTGLDCQESIGAGTMDSHWTTEKESQASLQTESLLFISPPCLVTERAYIEMDRSMFLSVF